MTSTPHQKAPRSRTISAFTAGDFVVRVAGLPTVILVGLRFERTSCP